MNQKIAALRGQFIPINLRHSDETLPGFDDYAKYPSILFNLHRFQANDKFPIFI